MVVVCKTLQKWHTYRSPLVEKAEILLLVTLAQEERRWKIHYGFEKLICDVILLALDIADLPEVQSSLSVQVQGLGCDGLFMKICYCLTRTELESFITTCK